MNLIDTHFHLDFYRDHNFWYNQINALEHYTLCVTNSPEIYLSCKKLYHETKYLKFALGYNPQLCVETAFNKKLFLALLKDAKYIGEVGLDYSPKYIHLKSVQLEAFDYICSCAAKQDKLMTVHSRKAEQDTLEILLQNGVKKAIIHWYTGDVELVKKYIDAGYYFSVNASMCTTQNGKKIIKQIPLDRLLVESDGPFSKIGTKKYAPTNLDQIYLSLSEVTENHLIESIVFENFNRLLRAN